MSSTKKLVFVWNQILKAIKACRNSFDIPSSDEVQYAINNSDAVLAKRLIDNYNLV